MIRRFTESTLHAPSVKDALDELAGRFGNELQEFEIQFADQSDLLASSGRLAATMLGDVVFVGRTGVLQPRLRPVLFATE